MANQRNPRARAREKALAALDQYETQIGLKDSERAFHKRLKSPRYMDPVGTAWMDIAEVRKRDDDDLLLINFMFQAWRDAQEVPSIPKAFEGPAEAVLRGRWCAEHLIALLQSGIFSPEGPQTTVNYDELLRSLESFRDILAAGERRIEATVSNLPLTRKSKTTTTKPGIFMFRMNGVMRKMFDRPLDDAVAALCTVAFEKNFTAAQVQRAVRSREPKL